MKLGYATVLWSSSTARAGAGIMLVLTSDLGAVNVRRVRVPPSASGQPARGVEGEERGKTLAVEATLYGRHKMLFVVTHAPNDAAGQRQYFDSLQSDLKRGVPDLDQRTVCWVGDFNCVENETLDDDRPQRAIPRRWHRRAVGARAVTSATSSPCRERSPGSCRQW